MQNYITNFKYHYELFPVKEINESNIIFANKNLPFELYIPSFQKAFLDIEKNPTLQVNYEDLIYNGQPSNNIFNFLELEILFLDTLFFEPLGLPGPPFVIFLVFVLTVNDIFKQT